MARYLVDVMMSRTKSGTDSPHLFVFLDDLLNLLGVADVDNELAQLASLGRAAGIHLIEIEHLQVRSPPNRLIPTPCKTYSIHFYFNQQATKSN